MANNTAMRTQTISSSSTNMETKSYDTFGGIFFCTTFILLYEGSSANINKHFEKKMWEWNKNNNKYSCGEKRKFKFVWNFQFYWVLFLILFCFIPSHKGLQNKHKIKNEI